MREGPLADNFVVALAERIAPPGIMDLCSEGEIFSFLHPTKLKLKNNADSINNLGRFLFAFMTDVLRLNGFQIYKFFPI